MDYDQKGSEREICKITETEQAYKQQKETELGNL
jgi:hypothetical protein